MSTGTRLLLAIFAGLFLLTTVTVGAAVAAVYHSGTIAVVPSEVLGEMTSELEPVWPTISAAARELDRAPDCTLLEVVSREGHVLIQKKSGRLLITVDDHGDRLSVALPLATIRKIVEKLG